MTQDSVVFSVNFLGAGRISLIVNRSYLAHDGLMNNAITDIKTTQDGDAWYRVNGTRNGEVVLLGWVEKWYETDAVNKTGIKRFAARPAGHHNSGNLRCESLQSALGFLKGYWEA